MYLASTAADGLGIPTAYTNHIVPEVVTHPPRHLWLCNVPNYVSQSPAGLLVPREVAKADGLTIASSRKAMEQPGPAPSSGVGR